MENKEYLEFINNLKCDNVVYTDICEALRSLKDNEKCIHEQEYSFNSQTDITLFRAGDIIKSFTFSSEVDSFEIYSIDDLIYKFQNVKGTINLDIPIFCGSLNIFKLKIGESKTNLNSSVLKMQSLLLTNEKRSFLFNQTINLKINDKELIYKQGSID
jgi:hypothetical protein